MLGVLQKYKLSDISTLYSNSRCLFKIYMETSEINVSSMLTKRIYSHSTIDKVHADLFNVRKVSPANFNQLNETLLRNLLKSTDNYKVIEAISERFRNGIFLDSKTGCYLMQNFIKNDDSLAAILIGHQLLKNEQLDEHVAALAAKSCYDFVQKFIQYPNIFEVEVKSKEQKLRTNFLSQYLRVTNLRDQIGNIISNLTSNRLPTHLDQNIKIITYAICKQNDIFMETINVNGNMFYNDTITLCRGIFEADNKNADSFSEFLLNIPTSKILNGSLSGEIEKYTNKIIKTNFVESENENKNSNYLPPFVNKVPIEEMDDKIEGDKFKKLRKQLKETSNNIWFFEIEDRLELQIYQKRTNYPVRWFGKKKTPKGVEDTYVPPEVQSRI